jgi:glycosyltransferase involved in cell wall biosynthesis
MADRFDAVLTCSPEDRDRLGAMAVGSPIHVTPNGVRTAYYDDVASSSPDPDTLAFVGSMDYHANISGIAHFVRTTLPLIVRERPALRFLVVGKNPPPQIRALASSNVIVTGSVEDVRPFLVRACVIVVPLLVGGGTRLKILEAMASGRPVVSTRHGAEGIAAGPEHLVLVDEPAAFAAAVVALMDDPARRERIGRAGRAFVSRCYDWSIITADLNETFARLLETVPAR